MKKVRSMFLGVVMTLVFAAAPVLAFYEHKACNCWEGDWICTYEDANHNIVGYAFYQDAC